MRASLNSNVSAPHGQEGEFLPRVRILRGGVHHNRPIGSLKCREKKWCLSMGVQAAQRVHGSGPEGQIAVPVPLEVFPCGYAPGRH